MSEEKKYLALFGNKDCDHAFMVEPPCQCVKCGAFEKPCCKEAADAWPTTESTVVEMGEKAYTYARENFDLRSKLSALLKAAEACAPKCECGKPVMYEGAISNFCKEHHKTRLCHFEAPAQALWSAIEAAKGGK